MPSAASLAENGLPSPRNKKSSGLNIDVHLDPTMCSSNKQRAATKSPFTSSLYDNHSKKHDHYAKPLYYNQYGSTQKRLFQRWGRLVVIVFGILLILSYIPFFSSTPTPTSFPPAYERPPDQHPVRGFPASDPSTRDQIVLYRIIGNDLPPRHKEGQTLSNLAFILKHEKSFPNTRKIFVLNRIVDPVNEAAIIRLLDEYKMEYIRAPFHEEEYTRIDFRLEDFPEKDFLHSDDYMHFSKVAKLRTLDYTYHNKNLYAMNNVS